MGTLDCFTLLYHITNCFFFAKFSQLGKKKKEGGKGTKGFLLEKWAQFVTL
jgi:hypothetical protein